MVGLGGMGASMARRLLKRHHECVVFNRSAKSVADLVVTAAGVSPQHRKPAPASWR
ncbi:MAG: NAD(P)-binding domain-containing protein [Bryobacterales bacterium]